MISDEDKNIVDKMSADELVAYVGKTGISDKRGQYANFILQSKNQKYILDQLGEIKKPHQLVIWGFVVALVTMILAAIAVIPMLTDLINSFKP